MRVRGLNLLVDVVGLVRRQKRTIGELVSLTGGTPETVRKYIGLLREEGLVTAAPIHTGDAGRPNLLVEWVQ